MSASGSLFYDESIKRIRVTFNNRLTGDVVYESEQICTSYHEKKSFVLLSVLKFSKEFERLPAAAQDMLVPKVEGFH